MLKDLTYSLLFVDYSYSQSIQPVVLLFPRTPHLFVDSANVFSGCEKFMIWPRQNVTYWRLSLSSCTVCAIRCEWLRWSCITCNWFVPTQPAGCTKMTNRRWESWWATCSARLGQSRNRLFSRRPWWQYRLEIDLYSWSNFFSKYIWSTDGLAFSVPSTELGTAVSISFWAVIYASKFSHFGAKLNFL